ncbi:MAG: cyclodeaminase/cyclohydrolase family protein [Deltaproteobacteria bacterium]|nr:cyclodeaminase/cyclohydrolase family protein [Deltaproteobacteria bacterium]
MDGKTMKFVQLSVQDFVARLAARTAVPGGGCAGALCGALGAGLSRMVASLTVDKDDSTTGPAEMKHVEEEARTLADHFLDLVDRDGAAYRKVIAAARLPRNTEKEKHARHAAIQGALKAAAGVPLETLRAAEKLLSLAKTAIELGNPKAVTDAGAALHLARGAASVALANVRINLLSIEDEAFVAECRRELSEVTKRFDLLFQEGERRLELRLV